MEIFFFFLKIWHKTIFNRTLIKAHSLLIIQTVIQSLLFVLLLSYVCLVTFIDGDVFFQVLFLAMAIKYLEFILSNCILYKENIW